MYANNRKKIMFRLSLLLSSARKHKTDLRLFMHPHHARRMHSIQKGACWLPYKQWVRDVVQVLAEDQKKHPHRPPIPLWYFDGYNEITMEPLPTFENDEATHEMQWYKDGIHYSRATGNLIQDRIFGYNHPERNLPEWFGVLLTEENVEEQLTQLEEDGELYQASET